MKLAFRSSINNFYGAKVVRSKKVQIISRSQFPSIALFLFVAETKSSKMLDGNPAKKFFVCFDSSLICERLLTC